MGLLPSRRSVTPREWYNLSPWRKFLRKGTLPLSFLCHLLLLSVVTVEICRRNYIWAPYTVGSHANFCHFFFPQPCVDSDSCSLIRIGGDVGDTCHLSTA